MSIFLALQISYLRFEQRFIHVWCDSYASVLETLAIVFIVPLPVAQPTLHTRHGFRSKEGGEFELVKPRRLLHTRK
jgi:hypothetical protein